MPAAHISHLGPVGTTRDEAIRVSTSPTVTFMTGLRSRLGHRYHRIVSKRDREHSVANQHRHRRQVLGAGAHPRSRPIHTEVGRARRTGEDSGVSGRDGPSCVRAQPPPSSAHTPGNGRDNAYRSSPERQTNRSVPDTRKPATSPTSTSANSGTSTQCVPPPSA